MPDDKNETIKVTDHRAFNPDGTPRESGKLDQAANEEHESGRVVEFPGSAKRESSAYPPGGGRQGEVGRSPDLPAPTFDSFINMLAVETLMHLGLIPNPMEESNHVDLDAAKHLIETIAMLQDKTRGNLTESESDMIENVLAELRLRFVAVSEKK